ncbi:MAG: tetratricopeptide repeat protein [Phocaeicola sp.]
MGILKSLFGSDKSDETKQTKIEEKNFDLLKYDGIRAQRLGKLTYAIKCWEEAIVLKKEEETLQLLAAAYTQANRLEEAQCIWQSLVELAPYKSEYVVALAQNDYMQELYEPMEEHCKKALELEKKDATIYLLSAKAAIGLHKEFEAIAALTRAIALKVDYIAAYQLRAQLLWEMRQVKDAAEDVEAILEIESENEEALLLKGEILVTSNRTEEAEVCLNHLLEHNPFNEKAYVHLATISLDRKDFTKALEVLDEAIEINPQVAAFYHERGRVKLCKGDKEGSMADMKRSIELSPKEATRFDGEHKNYENSTKNTPW